MLSGVKWFICPRPVRAVGCCRVWAEVPLLALLFNQPVVLHLAQDLGYRLTAIYSP